jgi:CheY-like chemotaxis protein
MKSGQSPRILVADDDLGVIAAYRYVLEGEHITSSNRSVRLAALTEELFGIQDAGMAEPAWRVDFVDQGEDAVKAVQKAVEQSDPYALVFLDIRMPPGLDGYETAEAIRRIDPLAYIVFVSAFSDYTREELREIAGGANRTAFLTKPVWPHQLMSVALSGCSGPTNKL